MKTVKKEQGKVYLADPCLEPIMKVKPGEKFKVETNDHFDQGLLNMLIESGTRTIKFTKNDFPPIGMTPLLANPVAGPIYVDGAEPGDLLAIHIWDIIPDEVAETCTIENFGGLASRAGWDDCQGNYAYLADILPGPSGTTSDGRVEIEIDDRKWSWHVNPHIGTIFTCPTKGCGIPYSLTTQGPWGGNQDIRDVCKGNTIYINSFNEGGLLFLGDVHASQGDSEFTGVAVETCADVILSVDVIKSKSIPGTLRIETPKSIIQVDSNTNAGTYRNALANSFIGLMKWLVEDYGYSKKEAYLQMSINSYVKINVYQFVENYFVCGVEYSKSCFPK